MEASGLDPVRGPNPNTDPYPNPSPSPNPNPNPNTNNPETNPNPNQVRGLELRATLQQCVARAAAAHGAAFGAAMQALDPDLMVQVQAAFGS